MSKRKPKKTTNARKKAVVKRKGGGNQSIRPDYHIRRQGVYLSPTDQCAEITTNRTRCKNTAQQGSMFCSIHQRKPLEHEDEFFDSTFARVDDGIWIGSLDTANDPKALRSAGIKSVVNISGWEPRQKTRDMYRLFYGQNKPGIKYYTTTTRDKTGKLRYLGDQPITTSQGLAEFYDYMDRGVEMMRQAPKPLLCHCHAGINRSASLVAAYLMAERGMTFDQARDLLINANRKRDTPVLTNRHFVNAMKRYI